ncbi:hypothetical protein NCLIV_038530 [Neospora caninum Liverpool]|uniref:Uncharacterized protein n=1 Tax=Neospora caninum (strain Liverpool) TaxID=572307 RepID=F0VAM3_NEOCL|nr:hypothetical protein NCLIV_038530 [Neospora caninum Liverpool]CBZ50778.1 hypothetical protein NCLIV_038530 [Neospora caninum Liverpool]CEL68078.1 TPA: hypothetical protein BN1204_038530 [Neospora caninum Liverpool]|eukprot:XP_003880811.1 hypothetical protein NCLIV_038530 [Neospora caninum Liverpool]
MNACHPDPPVKRRARALFALAIGCAAFLAGSPRADLTSEQRSARTCYGPFVEASPMDNAFNFVDDMEADLFVESAGEQFAAGEGWDIDGMSQDSMLDKPLTSTATGMEASATAAVLAGVSSVFISRA